MNEMVASESGIIKGLINLLGSSVDSVSMAACNAILDVSTASIGRKVLLKFSALKQLIVSFIQVHRSLPAVFSLSNYVEGNGSCLRIVFEKDDSTLTLLDAVLILINSCTMQQLSEIPRDLSERLVFCLKRLWEEVHKKMLCGMSLKCSQQGQFYVSNIGTNNLAESIFRLCINDCQRGGPAIINDIKRSIFSSEDINFEQFIVNYWEASPLLIIGSSRASFKKDNIFSSFAKCFRSKEVGPFLPSVLRSLTSCPPIASDELDVLHFLEEVRKHFGCPIHYQQDIRVVKTHHSEGEVQYFLERSGTCSSKDTHFLITNEIIKFQDAYNEGYTIALRGMEFRFGSIAVVADGLASLFGQPSAGVNMYLTPPNSQGLSCHSDDHCVFVCQLSGVKEWKIFPRSSRQLPRLYESVYSWPDSEVEKQVMAGSQQFLLKEGDVLYIPRGFPHEARTIVDEDGSAEFSLHLTLAIEVEPPFEWEGFTHVALDHWCKKHREPHHPSFGSMSWSLHVVSVHLLHVAIKLMGDIDPTFRKACLVGAISLSSVNEGWLIMNQTNIFKYLISRINAESKFLDAAKCVETAFRNQEDIFQRERWLQNLTKEEDMAESHNSNISSVDTENIFHICNQHRDTVEAAFVQVKSKFCNEVLFEDVEPSYKMLLERYKKVRKQYTNGMLSLHLTGEEFDSHL